MEPDNQRSVRHHHKLDDDDDEEAFRRRLKMSLFHMPFPDD